ncbi:3-isopropylmalate dehydrogenase, partial [Patescibacteria group bacterium]|nr:3-isopropylmalate dehydrogenase [Patescibacteria group bacterium]
MDKELIVSLPGDGIGPEVMREGVRTLKLIEKKSSHNFELKEALIGGAAIDKFGEPLPAETLSLCKMASATLLGAVGGYKWDNLPSSKRPERALLGLRGELGVFANLRPIKLYKSLVSVSPLKKSVVGEGLNILVVRELTGGLYFGHPRGKCNLPDGTVKAINTLSYTEMEIERIFRVAFELAQK